MSEAIMFNGSAYCRIGNNLPIFFIAGPCAIESMTHALETAQALKEAFRVVGMSFVYKSSFDKANRSSSTSFRGPGLWEGLEILANVRERVGVPVCTDIHLPEQANSVAAVVDMLQIPAFLSRQTDLIEAAASTGKPLNIKKGQFMAPWEMSSVFKKARAARPDEDPAAPICLCERGTFFGYGNLVVDMRGLEMMKGTGTPVVFDATHSVQLPGAAGSHSGGQREFVAPLARAAVAVGVAGVFLETHRDPDNAPCDGPNMVPLCHLPDLLEELKNLDSVIKGFANATVCR